MAVLDRVVSFGRLAALGKKAAAIINNRSVPVLTVVGVGLGTKVSRGPDFETGPFDADVDMANCIYAKWVQAAFCSRRRSAGVLNDGT